MLVSELKILLVDTCQSNLALLGAQLAEQRCALYQTQSVQDALDIVREFEFALVLISTQLPKINGKPFLSAMRELPHGKHVPVICFVPMGAGNDPDEFYEEGVVDCFSLPVRTKTIAHKAQFFLELCRQDRANEKNGVGQSEKEPAATVAEGKYEAFFHRAVEGTFRCTIDGTFTTVNPAFAHILGYSCPDEIVGVAGLRYAVMTNGEQQERYLGKLRSDGYVRNYNYKAIRHDGHETWLSESAWLVTDEQQNELFIEGIVEDISRRKRHESELRYLATMDSLTGVPNRHVFFDRLEHAVEAARRYKTMLAVLFLDLDKFKKVNDSFGHYIGDLLLGKVAKRCLGKIRAADTFARIGGDEFGVLLERIENVESVSLVAQSLLSALQVPFTINGKSISVGATIGISLYPFDGDAAVSLLNKADLAMYRSKKGKEVGYAFYSST